MITHNVGYILLTAFLVLQLGVPKGAALAQTRVLAPQAKSDEQQDTIKFELEIGDFALGIPFQIELKLRYFVFDDAKMKADNAQAYTQEYELHEQFSENTHQWDISFDKKGKITIKGSKQASEFRFKEPLGNFGEAQAGVQLSGKLVFVTSRDTMVTSRGSLELPLDHAWPFHPGATYVFLIENLDLDGSYVKKFGPPEYNSTTGRAIIKSNPRRTRTDIIFTDNNTRKDFISGKIKKESLNGSMPPWPSQK
jgi:hypothetical protein